MELACVTPPPCSPSRKEATECPQREPPPLRGCPRALVATARSAAAEAAIAIVAASSLIPPRMAAYGTAM
jgi:hypothetical protein